MNLTFYASFLYLQFFHVLHIINVYDLKNYSYHRLRNKRWFMKTQLRKHKLFKMLHIITSSNEHVRDIWDIWKMCEPYKEIIYWNVEHMKNLKGAKSDENSRARGNVINEVLPFKLHRRVLPLPLHNSFYVCD